MSCLVCSLLLEFSFNTNFALRDIISSLIVGLNIHATFIFRIKNSLSDILVALGAEDKDYINEEAADEKKDKEKTERKCEALIIISSLIISSLR